MVQISQAEAGERRIGAEIRAWDIGTWAALPRHSSHLGGRSPRIAARLNAETATISYPTCSKEQRKGVIDKDPVSLALGLPATKCLVIESN